MVFVYLLGPFVMRRLTPCRSSRRGDGAGRTYHAWGVVIVSPLWKWPSLSAALDLFSKCELFLLIQKQNMDTHLRCRCQMKCQKRERKGRNLRETGRSFSEYFLFEWERSSPCKLPCDLPASNYRAFRLGFRIMIGIFNWMCMKKLNFEWMASIAIYFKQILR